MRIDSAQLTNASISGSFSGSITSTAEQPIVSGSSQVVLTATTGFGTYSASVATYTDAKVADLVDSSPGALDTLNELAAALGDDSNFSASLATSVGNRLPTATFNTYSGSSAGAIRGEYVAAVNTLSGSAHIRRNQISASLDATIDALDSLGISTDTERGALSGSAHTDRIAKVSVLSGSAHTDRIAKVGILSGSAHAQRVIEKNIAAGLVSSLSGGQVATNATTAGAALPKVGGAMTGAITTNSTFDGRDVATNGTKLDGIEASATADQTNDEIKAAVEAASDSNTFTDDDHTKLNAIEASATADQTASELRSAIGTGNGNLVPSAGSSGQFLKHDGTFGTPSYTTNTNTTTTSDVTSAGALMDSEVDNLAEVKAFDSTDYATAAQGTKADAALPKGGGAMTGAITTNSTFDGRDVATDGTKLDGIEASADVTDATNVAANLPSGTVSGSASQAQTQIGLPTALALKANLASPSLSGNPTAPTQAANNNSTRIATTAYVQTELTDLIGGAPGTLDTLNELAAAINDDDDYSSTLTTALATKAPKASPTFTGTIAIPNIANLETAVAANTAKATDVNHNVTTNLTITGTTGARTIVSSDGTDAIIPIATTALAGVMSKAIFDEHVVNNAKSTDVNHNVTTNLSITGTTGARTIVSSDGTNAIIPIATAAVAGVMSKAIFDQHVLNNAKATDVNHNVSTNLTATTAAAQITINSSDGDNVVIGEATTSIAGLMSTTHHDKLDGIDASADVNRTDAQIKTSIGTGNSKFVPSAGTAGHFLKHDGTFGIPGYTTNTDTNDDVSVANLKTRLAGGFAGNAVTIGDANDVVTIGGSLVSTGDITAFSDVSLKKDVATIEGALDKTKALRGVSFTRKADDSKSIGVIAQELEAVLPELVKTGDDGIKSVNYAQITGLLIEAVKELSAKLDECMNK